MKYDDSRPTDLPDAAFQAHRNARLLKCHLEELKFPSTTSALVILRSQKVTSALGGAHGVKPQILPDLSALSDDLDGECAKQTSAVFVNDEYNFDGGMVVYQRSPKGDEISICRELVGRLVEAIINLDAMKQAQDQA